MLYFLILEKKSITIFFKVLQNDKTFDPVFYVEQFLREFGSKGAQQESIDLVGI